MVEGTSLHHTFHGHLLSTQMLCRSQGKQRGVGAPRTASGTLASTAPRPEGSPSTSSRATWCAELRNQSVTAGEDAASQYISTIKASNYPSRKVGRGQRDSLQSYEICTASRYAMAASSSQCGSQRMKTLERTRSHGKISTVFALGLRTSSRARSSAPTRSRRLSRLGASIQCLHVWRSCD